VGVNDTPHRGARPSRSLARFWSTTTDRALALVFALAAGLCAAPLTAETLTGADGFIFSVGPDGQLISVTAEQSTLRAFVGDDEAQTGGQTDRLFLFAAPHTRADNDPLSPVAAAAIIAPRAALASPEILQAIETTALRYAGHSALRRAGLSVTDWVLFYRANIEVESAYNPSALSPVGAIGLGQLMPETARDLGVDPHDMAQNLDGSARYLLMVLEQFGDPALALAAYNAGPEAVTRHGGIPPFRETQGHVARVTAVFQRLRGDLS
jgi:soluble lytic murein transglycosylase-like protein